MVCRDKPKIQKAKLIQSGVSTTNKTVILTNRSTKLSFLLCSILDILPKFINQSQNPNTKLPTFNEIQIHKSASKNRWKKGKIT